MTISKETISNLLTLGALDLILVVTGYLMFSNGVHVITVSIFAFTLIIGLFGLKQAITKIRAVDHQEYDVDEEEEEFYEDDYYDDDVYLGQ